MEEGGREDDEEEAYGEDLAGDGFVVSRGNSGGRAGVERVGSREKHTKDNAMIVLRPAAILSVCRVH